MASYLAPGVYVEETSFRSKSIAGVGTSVAGMVGPTRTGPVRGRPEPLTSFEEYSRIYGDLEDLALTDPDRRALNLTALAALAFFENGGRQLFVVRTFAGVNQANTDENGEFIAGQGAPEQALARDGDDGALIFRSRFPGAMGNYILEFTFRPTGRVIEAPEAWGGDEPTEDGQLYLLEATGLTADIRPQNTAGNLPDGANNSVFPMGIRAMVRRDQANNRFTLFAGARFRPARTQPAITAASFAADGNPPALMQAGLVAAEGVTVRLRPVEIDIDVRIRNDLRPGLPDNLISRVGEVFHSYARITTDTDGESSLFARLPVTPESHYDELTSPIACTAPDDMGTRGELVDAIFALFDADAMDPPGRGFEEPRFLIELGGGSDGTILPGAADYRGEGDERNGSTGFVALEDIDDVAIVMTPAAVSPAYPGDTHDDTHLGIVGALRTHCLRMRYRVGIVDSRAGMTIGEVRAFRDELGSEDRLALYYPWVTTPDPRRRRRIPDVPIDVPASGFMAGVYASTDVTRGVHKSPANAPVIGALRFAQNINHFQQELLNPNGVNVLRFVLRRGYVVWGGRTLSTDVEWQYVNVRRYFLYLERSIDTSTQWAVFEPNGPRLWDNIRGAVEDFLYNEWFNNRLLGGSPKEAYFVRCDRSTMTQNDIDSGRMVCLVGVSPLRPAEYVVFRIGQKTADAKS